MANFPKLKTSAIAQYPATRAIHFRNQILPFLDGSDQRYRDWPGSLRQWGIRLDILDESEMAALEEFFITTAGSLGSFEFTDPWDGQTYTNCSFGADELTLTSLGEMNGRTALTILQNRR
jgi:uncharacterized protein DUF2460